ncbi:MAG: PilZ domain-containing protein [Nitrospirota bacterium]
MIREKRTHYRLRIVLPLLYRNSRHDGTVKKALTCDISDSGLSFYSSSPQKKGTKLQITLMNIFAAPKDCTVIWQEKKDSRTYRVGVHFQKNKVQSYLQR